MGIIQRQAITGTIFSYMGAVLGFITVGLLFPNILTTDENGLIKLLISYSVLFSRFANLGFNGVTNRLFSFFRNPEKNHHGFVFIATLVIGTGFLLSMLLFFILRPIIIQNSIEKSNLFIDYLSYLIPLIFFTLLFDFLDGYSKILYNAVQGTFLKDVLQRILILISIVAYASNLIGFYQFIQAYVFATCLPGVILAVILKIKGKIFLKPEFSFLNKEMIRNIGSVSFYSILGGFGGIIVANVDAIMINSMIDLSSTGIYGITFFFGTLIIIPSRSLLKISTPVISEAMKSGDIKTIREVYYKSALTQFIIGSLIFIGIWGNIHNVFEILPAEYLPGKYVIFFIGLVNLLDMAIGANGLIIGLSDYYKYQAHFIFLLAVLVIITNILLIPRYGIVGAALASLMAKFIFNLIRYLFVWKKFKLQPYNYRFVLVIFISIICYLTSRIIPVHSNFILDILIRSLYITFVFGVLILLLNISQEITNIFWKIIRIFTNQNRN